MRRQNLYLIIIIALLFYLLLLGCSTKEKRLVFGGIKTTPLLIELIDKYEEEHPEIAININTDKVERADFFAADLEMAASWIKEEEALALDKYLKEAQIEETDFLAPTFATVKQKDEIYGLPWYVDVGVLYYRKDLVPYAPDTWNELVFLSQNYRDENIWGIVFQCKPTTDLVCNVLEYFWSNGGTLFTAEGEAVYFESEQNIDALRFMVNVVHWHHIAPKDVLEYDREQAQKDFLENKAIFMRGWTAPLKVADKRKVGIAPLPKGIQGQRGVSCLTGKNLMISADCKHKKEAFAFINWLTGPEAQKFAAIKGGWVPTRRAVFTDLAVIEQNPYFSELLPIIYGARVQPTFLTNEEVLTVLQDNFYKPLQRKARVYASLKDTTERVRKFLEQPEL